ncbi:MAG: efflux RND transporter periplasmic adaptor subunit [Lachnospiraceae bacterium]|nr:efflux RND transporter periplasmic adaptor subunit [Lachnospiraceae bacterium]
MKQMFFSGVGRLTKRIMSITLICALSVAGLTSCGSEKEEKELLEPLMSANEVAVCERGDIEKLIIKDGHVEGDYEILSFDVDGYLYQVFSTPGDKVGKGDSLAAVTSADFEEIMTLEEEIESLKEDNKKRKDFLEAEVKLKEQNGENATEERFALEKEVALMDLKLAQKERRYEKLKSEDIGYNYISAPSNGYVVAVTSTTEGAYITAGTPVAALANEDTKPFISCEFISEKQSHQYKSFYALINGKEYPLTYVPIDKEQLTVLSAAGKIAKSHFEFAGEVADEIKLGDYAAVVIVADRKENVLTIPVNSVFTDKGGRFVYVIDEDGGKERREVVTGLSDGARIEVTEGVREGENIYVEN